jgi:DNA-binding transcriptional MerR regulator
VDTSSLRQRYLQSFAGRGTPEAAERGRAGYSLGRRYLASLFGVRLLPHPSAVRDSGSGPEVDEVRDHGSGPDVPESNNPMPIGTQQDAGGSAAQDIGYRGPVACAAARVTYRQLDYWSRTGLVPPSVRPAGGSDSEQGLYSFRDILVLKVVRRLLDTGISLQQIRAAVHHLRGREISDLAQITLMSDGDNVYECTTADQVVNLLQGGHGIFGIALDRIWREVVAELAEFPAVRGEDRRADAPTPEAEPSSGTPGAEPSSAERREQAEELLASLPETVSSMSKLPKREREELVTLLADLPPTISGLAELSGVVSSAVAEGRRRTA